MLFWNRLLIYVFFNRFNFLDKSVGLSSPFEMSSNSVVDASSKIVEARLPVHLPGVEGFVIPSRSRGHVLRMINSNTALVRWEVNNEFSFWFWSTLFDFFSILMSCNNMLSNLFMMSFYYFLDADAECIIVKNYNLSIICSQNQTLISSTYAQLLPTYYPHFLWDLLLLFIIIS